MYLYDPLDLFKSLKCNILHNIYKTKYILCEYIFKNVFVMFWAKMESLNTKHCGHTFYHSRLLWCELPSFGKIDHRGFCLLTNIM